MNTNKIYVIMWQGRDCDSGVWDVYPYDQYGWFDDKEQAEKFCEELNKLTGAVINDTDEDEYFFAQEIVKATDETVKHVIKNYKEIYNKQKN